jgi:hypothetical protein
MVKRDNTDSLSEGGPVIPPSTGFPFSLRGRRGRRRRRRRRSVVLLSQNACTERPIRPRVEEETPLPSSDEGGGGNTDTQPHRHYILEESRIKYVGNMSHHCHCLI